MEIMTCKELFKIISHYRPPRAAREWRSRADFFAAVLSADECIGGRGRLVG